MPCSSKARWSRYPRPCCALWPSWRPRPQSLPHCCAGNGAPLTGSEPRSDLARQANVSNATVSRFVQKLGYTNHEEARRHVHAERQSGAALFLTGSEIQTSEKAFEKQEKEILADGVVLATNSLYPLSR